VCSAVSELCGPDDAVDLVMGRSPGGARCLQRGSEQLHELPLGVGIAVNIALRCLETGVPRELLHIAETPADR
jgi:hypothetical protein